ncbi:PhoX family phosphatase [Frankia sp. Cr2]|uniref:PhoX family protein n=1 Tax=Frankia sp. Cr2 TaxID=3073932 RepID=UPI002AD2C661|nr:PhoX family phosphatase [Frankia sp. Cr2]
MRDTDDIGSNPTDNPALSDLIAARFSRRAALGGGLAAATVGFLGGGVLTAAAAEAGSAGSDRDKGKPHQLLGFAEVPTSTADTVVVPEGYTYDVLIPWGTPLLSSGPAWKKDGSNTAAEQAQQVGMHHDGMHFFPQGGGWDGPRRGLLVVNHEYIDQVLLNPDGATPMTAEKVAKALAAHGVTVIQIRLENGKWSPVDSRYNRRITGATPVAFSGPVSLKHPELTSNNPPLGTLNNCAHGVTPWGTYLACEENWNGYFGTDDASWTPTVLESRYGVTRAGFGYNWHKADARFDLAVNRKELNRFGWVVEIDPFNPRSTPVKRTALGRIKHEGATVTEHNGRVVVYTGDDENREYLYKFVGTSSWKRLLSQGKSPLDHGTLYVAQFNGDGSGTWLPVVWGSGPLTTAGGWADQADVLIRARQAADALGATKLDRPEWVAVHPHTKDVFVTLTNGSAGPTPVNPRATNIYGHILRFRETGHDNTATTFSWDIFAFAGDPAYQPEGQFVPETQPLFGSPDGLWVDPDGRLWIETDISNSSQNLASRKYDRIGNNALLAADPSTGEIRRFLTGPRGCEITGLITTPDQETMFVNIQHPGEATTAWGSPTVDNPRAVSNWPEFDPTGRPRAATVVIRKIDGGKIGT